MLSGYFLSRFKWYRQWRRGTWELWQVSSPIPGSIKTSEGWIAWLRDVQLEGVATYARYNRRLGEFPILIECYGTYGNWGKLF